jgi:hypothetical protein
MEIVHNQKHLTIVVSHECSYRYIQGASGIYERGFPKPGERAALEVDVYIKKDAPRELFDRISASLSQQRGLSVIAVPMGMYTYGYFTIWTHKETDLYHMLRTHHLI